MERDHERVIQANESFGNAIFTDAKNLEQKFKEKHSRK
jgi:hypothetical protein